MSEEDQSGEKEFEATEQKLAEQRRKGEVPRSTDLNTAAAFFGLLLAALAAGPFSLTQIGETGTVLLDQSDRISTLLVQHARALLGGLMGNVILAALPLVAIPMLIVWAMLFAQRVVIFAPEKLKPKASRVSVIANAKNKFGRSGLFEFAKSTVKLATISAVLWFFLLHNLPLIIGSLYLTPALATTELLGLVVRFLALVFVVKLVIGGIDFFWQRAEHLRRNRMSHKDMHDEMKQSEGDPHAKGERRRRGREIAGNRMLDAVPDASVVIVNPTHYAVALKWSAQSSGAPVCVAKGVDEIALRIRERAKETGVPIHSDPVTARALYASVDIDAEVQSEHYRAVAAAIRFANTVRAKARKGRWS
ncbi:EscU/YscU/HrcU family type III secretion system export apparatus switch protein [Roseinatronobacter alkalisoli]|uniref:Flagellar type III secretion system protein FlhB n=1 Tax=Roseinatronobacter alkalisoli TaxID=3028235 RepID=A0ABT5T4W7_9RHOB|nr:flagellar type III secretion system protein FlhB [Roseinatronobacter sp. HJB301]MDD7970162.1 flagellar type III secretion system protein FlhB [Roseinatronobacter sp. HJB301]